jgi:CBS domain-containing protein
MNARDVMTPKVITAKPGTPVGEIAALLFEHRISAVPVVDKGRLVGIVSEANLLRRYEIGTDRARSGESWWMRLFGTSSPEVQYVRSHARRARDIMTPEVATVAPDTSLGEIATLLEKRRIKRVPVLERGRLVGIVSRADLVGALVSAKQAGRAAGPIGDEAIRSRLLAELEGQEWWRAERVAARVAAETVPGVRRVVDRRMVFRDLPSMV